MRKSHGLQPDPAQNGGEVHLADPALRRTLRLSILEGSFTQTFLTWTTGSVLIGYLFSVGASPTQLALVGSVPLLAQVSSPFVAWLAVAWGRRKALTMLLALLGRGLWVGAALLPQLGVPVDARAGFLVALVGVSGLFQASAGALWASWMGDVVPERRRGRYFGLRSGVVGIVGMLASLAAGRFLDLVAAPMNFQIVIGVAVVTAMIGVALYGFHYEPPASQAPASLATVLVEPWRDANFRRFLLYGVYWQAAVLLAAPFILPYFLDGLGMSFTQVAVWSAIVASCTLVTASLWGRMADRYGNKPVLTLATVLSGTVMPATWILATPSRLWPIWLSGVVGAVAWGAIGPALFNLALAKSPPEKRITYYAMFSLVTGVAGFLGGLLSGPLFLFFQGLDLGGAGFTWTAYHSLFVLSGVARSQAWWLLRRVEETNAWQTRDVLRQLRFGWRGAGLPWRS